MIFFGFVLLGFEFKNRYVSTLFYNNIKSDSILEYLKDEQLPTEDSNKVLFWINCFKGDWIEYHVELTGPRITRMISMSNASQTLWSAEEDRND